MNDRRMISRRITDTTKFLLLSLPQQALYFHLILHADDDGAVEAFTVLRSIGATEEDLRVLADKGFAIILNDDLVTYIPDWLEHNVIRPDRKKDSMYKNLILQVVPEAVLKPSKANDGQVTDKRRTNGGISKVKLSKDKVSKNNNSAPAPQDAKPADSGKWKVPEVKPEPPKKQISLEDVDINTPEGYAVIKEAYKGYIRRYYSGIKITDRDIRNWWDLRKEGYDFIPTGEE